MRVTVTRLTTPALARKACQFTMHSQNESKISMADLYRCEHSPIRTQIYTVEMYGIPSFVSVHLTRHNVGVTHFVQTMRDDRGATDTADRMTPVNHMMLVNAQALLAIGRKRLCHKAHAETRLLMEHIRDHLRNVDVDLAEHMAPECEYRGNVCHEMKMCGKMPGVVAGRRK